MIDTVFFDIGNVLLKFDAALVLERVRAEIQDPHADLESMFWCGPRSRLASIELGHITGEEAHKIFKDACGWDGGYDDFKRLWCDQFVLNEPMEALLERLRQTRKVFLLSNTNELHYGYFEEVYRFPKLVHGAALSYKLGLCKPDREIYEAAVKLAGSAPESCFFIDDLEANVKGARSAGLKAFRFTGDMDALAAEMKRLGLPV